VVLVVVVVAVAVVAAVLVVVVVVVAVVVVVVVVHYHVHNNLQMDDVKSQMNSVHFHIYFSIIYQPRRGTVRSFVPFRFSDK
jgi:ABC-type cobalt transport system substrate-binding protein